MAKERLSARHRQTFARLFEEPTRADIDGDDFVGLYLALGGDKPRTGKTGGSRRRLKLNGVNAVLHCPHPGSIMGKGTVRSARALLENAGFAAGGQCPGEMKAGG